jgi:hypothetical protein
VRIFDLAIEHEESELALMSEISIGLPEGTKMSLYLIEER